MFESIGATNLETYGRIINQLQKIAELSGKKLHTIAHYSLDGYSNEHATNVSRDYDHAVLIVMPHGYELMWIK